MRLAKDQRWDSRATQVSLESPAFGATRPTETDEEPEAMVRRDKLGAVRGTLYGFTIFVSAFLLFQVEPIIAKIIVPWFGGSSAVWTTCLLFFQLALLLGYLYAHWVVRRLRRRVQTTLHLLLVALSLAVLPILPNEKWKPLGPEHPVLHILLLLGATVGLPFFLLSTTSPLMQAWYAQLREDAKPYRLYALSNAGSLLALISYPVLIEPYVSTRHQAIGWSLAFSGCAALCAILAIGTRNSGLSPARAETLPPKAADQVLWVALPACASVLLLAITSHLTQNVAAVPFLWILPLSLYLLSFILCFEGHGWYRRDIFLRILAVALGGMTYALGEYSRGPLAVIIPLFSGGLFVCCMVCHGELARLKPAPEHLTSFYLMCSAGGAIGGIFVAGIAPHVFRGYFELPIGLASCAVLVLVVLRRDPSSMFYQARWHPAWLVMLALTLVLIIALGAQIRATVAEPRVMVRNFYGCLRVIDENDSDSEDKDRQLMNGNITHGEEFLFPGRRRAPTTYYGPNSGVGLALQVAGRRTGLHVGVIGLGAGTIAAYGRPGDRYTFYDINPLVIELARTQFYYLRDSPAQIEIIPGDARLSLERQPDQNFDVLAVDAFSGDAIPVHLLTREAFALYFRHLKPTGVLAVHLSNRYLDLRPVVKALAHELEKPAVVIDNGPDEDNLVFRATWALVSNRQEFLSEPEIKKAGTPFPRRPALRVWTDDYSSLLGILK